MDAKAQCQIQAGLLELATGWVDVSTRWSFDSALYWMIVLQTAERGSALALRVVWKPKRKAAASSKSRTPSMCQPGLNLPLWGQRLWSLYSIDGVWIKECKRCSLRYFSGLQLRKSIGRLYGSTYDRYYQSLVLPTNKLYKVDISLNRTHLFLLVETKLNSFSSHFYF